MTPFAAGEAPEKTDLTLGLVPLTDCAPIAIAVEHGFFAQQGLNVTTTREHSWAGIRDQVAFGVLDAAQMLATMPLCTTLGLGGLKCPMVTALVLDLGGNAITLSTDLADALRCEAEGPEELGVHAAEPLRRVLRQRADRGEPPLRLGMVFPMSTHDLELRFWLASAGIDPDRDVELVVVPPPRMVDALERGELSGFCVGEPWNSLAVDRGLGEAVITKQQLWNHSPEKVLGVTAQWAQNHPRTHAALIRSLLEACRWLDQPENRAAACQTLALPQYVGVDAALLEHSMTGRFATAPHAAPAEMPDFHVFHQGQANFPWRSHAVWFLTQMMRWGRLDRGTDVHAVARQVIRPDLYRDAAQAMGLPCPDIDYKTEGHHPGPWALPAADGPLSMGPDQWFDGHRFDPDQPIGYLEQFAVPRPSSALPR
ncbi:MAG: CmpA/NrtA family ABC transporter substrate-binding protein [Planctomycetota bacterium]